MTAMHPAVVVALLTALVAAQNTTRTTTPTLTTTAATTTSTTTTTTTTTTPVREETFVAAGGDLAFHVKTDSTAMASIGVLLTSPDALADPQYITPDATGSATEALNVRFARTHIVPAFHTAERTASGLLSPSLH